MTEEFIGRSLPGARFRGVDLRGAIFRDCDLRGARFADCWLSDLRLDGLMNDLWVNGVDVTPLVAAELDRRQPERAQLRAATTADEYRQMWQAIEQMWATTVARARKLPEPALHERVDEEWSFVETLRHLVFATDAWVNRAVLDPATPFSRIGLTHSSYPREDAVALGMDLDACPTLDEVLEVRADRLALVRSVVDGMTDASMGETCARTPAPGYPEELPTVGECVRVVMEEEIEHNRYATRDLSVLETR
jgi:hypothetical protein